MLCVEFCANRNTRSTSASEMTYIVSSGALNSTHSLTANNIGTFSDVRVLTRILFTDPQHGGLL